MLAYVNGQFVPEEEATVSIRDRGFTLGDAVFEVWRSYGGTPHQPMVEKNLARLTRGLSYMELAPDKIVQEVHDAAQELIVRSQKDIAAAGDVLFFVIVSRGLGLEQVTEAHSATVTIALSPMPFKQFGPGLHTDGAKLVTSVMYRDPWGAVDPRIKTTSRMGYVRAERKMRRAGAGAWVVLSDNQGNVTEASGANLMLLKDGVVVRPPRERVLGGINQDTFLELAAGLGVEAEERDLTLYDYLNADEVVLTTTSVGAAPVREIDGIALKRRGDVIARVQRAWIDYVGFDFIAQAEANNPR